ncbi:hypothetical protein [Kitasatospora sp. GP82]|uniref:hypothetical protein n=1 Tax=Kitasatospora sp. GP82 TaxID=3035089 RepID=UPI0024732C31|nr:hypothetical protein [Kitasatospora sp. GP82]
MRPNTVWKLVPDTTDDIIPGLVAVLVTPVFLVLGILWLVELMLRLLATPVVSVLRATAVVPYRVELLRNRKVMRSHEPLGRVQLRQLRMSLSQWAAQPGGQAGDPWSTAR